MIPIKPPGCSAPWSFRASLADLPQLFILSLGLILALALRSPAAAQPALISEVVSAGKSWGTFTNPDGTGLYHEILEAVFALHNISVRHEYATSDRAEELVRLGQADMMLCADKASPPLVMARMPMYQNAFHVFFSRERIGLWQGAESLRNKLIISQPGYYSQTNFPVPVRLKFVTSGTQALGMVLLGRADFYVDDMILMQESVRENTIPFNAQDFDIRQAGVRSYHPLFSTSERGLALMELYDEGIRTLHSRGILRSIYEKWGHPYPDFDRR
ncbi:transporter substrate-binding domain-containing protein [Pseudodesulfovibrio sp. F-1]|uniref:Transporter substrate-binding domain-containing protein n=1 Tax=Pseudodesulfovibrio alkaliphilus TaxID=2661613 RepID=A0A7K1KRG6_9BACT|nr:transporter substrate-binding domain-containing protein [Pseudodesulfovibrio alkaliphilus]MUM78696.1 transporter substrate-binding domain-containing protein [Pseudodesulfovibrio alkaliphilus]